MSRCLLTTAIVFIRSEQQRHWYIALRGAARSARTSPFRAHSTRLTTYQRAANTLSDSSCIDNSTVVATLTAGAVRPFTVKCFTKLVSVICLLDYEKSAVQRSIS
jgi:hypothetical protein